MKRSITSFSVKLSNILALGTWKDTPLIYQALLGTSTTLKACVILGVRTRRTRDGRGRDGNCAKEGGGGKSS